MATGAIFMPDAPDSDVLAITPTLELQSCNHLLDDHAALMRFHDEEGYLLLRGVLDPESIEQARVAMFAVMVRHGLIAAGAQEPVWTGHPFSGGMEESEDFSGIARALIEHPANSRLMERILGEPASIVPIVQYRTYPPGGSITGIHQDGFYSPGIMNYKPVWTAITPCPREVGGLMVAVRQCKRGFLHNVAKRPSAIPAGLIPDDCWATTDYDPGDVLILNPFAPHASMPNRSDKCRVTIDTRVQSAANPRVVSGEVLAASSEAVEVRLRDGTKRRFVVDDDTFIRIQNPGIREDRADYAAAVNPGKRIVVVFSGEHAETLRRASEN